MRISYLIGQYPAINHGYLLREIALLRERGFEVETISISAFDRPLEKLTPEERTEAERTFYVKRQSFASIAIAQIRTILRRPRRYLRAFFRAIGTGKARPLFYFLEAVVAGDWLHSRGIDLVQIHFALNVAIPLVAIFDLRACLTVHGFGELTPPGSAALTKLAPQLQLIRSISSHGRSMAMELTAPEVWSRIVRVPLGVELDKFHPAGFQADVDPFELLAVGRLAPEKAYALLISAVARLLRKGRNVRLRIAGDGPLRAELEKQARESGAASSIIFEGFVDPRRLIDDYRRANAFVMSSVFEGIPIVLMEAMALQIPCVAPRITGIPELIEDRSSGLLFDAGDEDDLERALTELIENPDLRRTLGENARRRVEHAFDLRTNTDQFAAILRERFDT